MEHLSASEGTPVRNVTDAARRAELLADYAASGLTQREFASGRGINYHTFISWLTHRRRAEASAYSPPSQSSRTEMIDGTSRGDLEVTLHGEIVVRGSNPQDVATLVRFLRNNS